MAFTSLRAKENHLTNNSKLLTDTLKKDGIDPVCKMKVRAGNIKTATYDQLVYGFCSESCKQKFVKEPAKYIKK
ncbi:YHS domain-containing protein [Pedobacter punctiformis]|uniref:YHS domain-containing protein n=1 Tax=Pedobacter punctiformis TaxID=3004097 RepID=A0ABT4L712_9SPHI|nr:YHS domain-containing protein [Pedobacter sp. HCMS5-2]MCZ4243709.1 YHS domain-containing protein [Pedobacter sp. HCMS5-2]